MKIHITSFVRRQTAESGYSHWIHSDEALIAVIEHNFHKAKQGYREGVLLVPVNPIGFFSSVTELKEGDLLVGEYVARKAGEEPRKSSYALKGEKMPALSAYIVLYSHAVLAAEGKENETDADYEIVSVNASPTEEEAPIPTGSLIANHLQLSGGTATKMTDAEFVALLRKSVEFWRDKALVCPSELAAMICYHIWHGILL